MSKPKLVKSGLKTCEKCHHTFRDVEFDPGHPVCKTCEVIEEDKDKPQPRLELPAFTGFDIGRHIGISLDHYMRLERRTGFDCLLDDYRTITLSAEQKEALEAKGKEFVLVTERSGYDLVYGNGMRLEIAEEDLPALHSALKAHQVAAQFAGYVSEKVRRA